MVFVKNSTFFFYVFFYSKQSKKETYFDILDSIECFFDLKSETLAKSKKSAFCKGVSPWFLSKNRPFSYMFFWRKKSQKQAFFEIVDRKECFFDLKSEVLKNSKNRTFSQGVIQRFLAKNRPFSHMFFSRNKCQKQTFFDILDRKECFLDVKSEVLKNSKKSTFYKGVNPWSSSKNWPFSYMLFFCKKKPQRNSLLYSGK